LTIRPADRASALSADRATRSEPGFHLLHGFGDAPTDQGKLLPVQAKLRQIADERDHQRGQYAVGQDPLDRLPKLAELHKQGVLTDDEFEAAKRELLKRL